MSSLSCPVILSVGLTDCPWCKVADVAELGAEDFDGVGMDEAGIERILRYFAQHPPAFLSGARHPPAPPSGAE